MIKIVSFTILMFGLSAVAWVLLVPPQLSEDQVQTRVFEAQQKIELPTFEELKPLLSKRLQGPLEPPVVVVKQAVVNEPPVTWPNMILECVFLGSESKLAVLTANQKKYSCVEGDEILGVTINKIAEKEILISFEGEERTVQLQSDSAGQNVGGQR